MLSSHIDVTRVDFSVQIYAFFSIPTPFFDKVLFNILKINLIKLDDG